MLEWLRPTRRRERAARLAALVDRIVDAIAWNEESTATTVNWNDNGHGISVGRAQFNQRKGELPLYLRRCHDADPPRFAEIFDAYAADMRDGDYVRGVEITRGSDLGRRVQALLEEPRFQAVQTELLRAKVLRALALARRSGHTSELFVAQVADMGNQLGWGGLQACLRASNAAGLSDERLAIRALSAAGCARWAARVERDHRLAQVFSPDKAATA